MKPGHHLNILPLQRNYGQDYHITATGALHYTVIHTHTQNSVWWGQGSYHPSGEISAWGGQGGIQEQSLRMKMS